MGASETSPRLGAGVVMILSDYLGLDSHYNHQHLVLTVGPKPHDRTDPLLTRRPAMLPTIGPMIEPTLTHTTTEMLPTIGRSRTPAHRVGDPLCVCVPMIPQLSQDILRNTAISVTTVLSLNSSSI